MREFQALHPSAFTVALIRRPEKARVFFFFFLYSLRASEKVALRHR